jgi:transcriptional regulator with XRE-family HTH domain
MARKQQQEDPVMAKVRALFDKSGLSLQEFGLKMGCTPETARQAVFQFLKTSDPHISLLRRFAEAAGVTIEELVGKKKVKP